MRNTNTLTRMSDYQSHTLLALSHAHTVWDEQTVVTQRSASTGQFVGSSRQKGIGLVPVFSCSDDPTARIPGSRGSSRDWLISSGTRVLIGGPPRKVIVVGCSEE